MATAGLRCGWKEAFYRVSGCTLINNPKPDHVVDSTPWIIWPVLLLGREEDEGEKLTLPPSLPFPDFPYGRKSDISLER